jgi:hypothetical protein
MIADAKQVAPNKPFFMFRAWQLTFGVIARLAKDCCRRARRTGSPG